MKKDNSKFFLGIILGAAAGLVAGILTAPKSGKETRHELKEQGKKAFDETKKTKVGGQKLFGKFFKKKEDVEDEALGVVEEVAEDAAEAAEEAK